MAPISQQSETNFENDEISLKELIFKVREWWRYLLSKWILIIGFGLLGGVLGLVYSFYKKPVYTATTTFVLEDEQGSSLGGLAGLASIAGVDMGSSGGGLFQSDNLPELYKSRTMIEKTLFSSLDEDTTELLIDRYIKFNELKKAWAKRPDLLSINFKNFSKDNVLKDINPKSNRLIDSVISSIVGDIKNNYLKVDKPDKKLNIIQVDVMAKDEEFAKSFNIQIVKRVNDFFIQTKTKKSLDNVGILQRKTDSVRAVMNGAIYNSAVIVDATPNLNPTRQVQRSAPIQRAQFSAETNKAILGNLVQNLEATKMSLLQETPLIQVVDQPVFPLKVESFSKIKGIILGGLIFGILITLFLIFRKIITLVLA